MLLTIFAFLLVFFVITLVHEAGHLYAAKRAGIRVHEFGIGFGPSLFSFKKNFTTYRLNLFPILGYVKIAGIDLEEPQEKDTPETEKYYNKPVGKKFSSIFAGPFSNLLLGLIIFVAIFGLIGLPSGISNEIATINPGSVALNIGLKPGDKILAINGVKYAHMTEAVEFIHKNPGKKLVLTIGRGSKVLSFAATPEFHKRLKVGLIGFSLRPIYERVNLVTAFREGLTSTFGLVILTLVLFGQLILGKFSLSDLAGPIGIAQITGQYAQHGAVSLLNFIAFFSINVAVLNLLPLPALDGGRLFFVILEAIRKKPINIEKENKIHQVGLIILLSLMVIVSVNDIFRLWRK